jgi:hypothetical protein
MLGTGNGTDHQPEDEEEVEGQEINEEGVLGNGLNAFPLDLTSLRHLPSRPSRLLLPPRRHASLLPVRRPLLLRLSRARRRAAAARLDRPLPGYTCARQGKTCEACWCPKLPAGLLG